jgi:hypothetical protein
VPIVYLPHPSALRLHADSARRLIGKLARKLADAC